jgi:hypothetical protein
LARDDRSQGDGSASDSPGAPPQGTGGSPPTGSGASKSLALRIGLAGALGLGALVTGFIVTRPGRKLVGDVLAGRTRTYLESRVLDELWGDRVLGRRKLEAREIEPGKVALLGTVATAEEVGRALALAERAKGVRQVESQLAIDPEAAHHAWRRRASTHTV